MIGSLVARHQVKQAFSQLNQKNLEGFLSGWHEEAVFQYPGQLSVSGTFTGRDAIQCWFAGFFERFPRIQFQLKHVCVENLFDLAGNNNVIAYWDVALTNREGRAVENTGTNLIKIRGRKVVEVQDFFFYPERLALGWNETAPATRVPVAP
ncbi:MAG: nuclear transport factor 2 family protein [Pseudomonadota bacterium]|nr:nuclear transport factor 2 family protein [Pseudomonadota bacterium]